MPYDRPHIRYPFTRGANGKVNLVEQGSPEHVASQEAVVALCPVGFRTTRPEFGWTFPTFQGAPLSVDDLVTALNRFVPMSEVTASEAADLVDAATRIITVTIPVEEEQGA